MAVNQDIVDALVILDNAVQTQIGEATLTKEAADNLVTSFQATQDKVNTELNLVDNTSDASKIISDLVIAALALKQNNLENVTSIASINGYNLLAGGELVIQRNPTSLVTLGYDDRDDLRNPLLVPLPEEDDSCIVESIGQFIYVTNTDEPDDDETCFTAKHPVTGDLIGQWLLELPHLDYLNASDLFKDAILDEYMEDTVHNHETHHEIHPDN
jgi:hypothetical protein